MVAFLLGLALFTASPPEVTAKFIRIPFAGSYLITYFDLTVVLASLTLLWNGQFRFDKAEKSIYGALVLVMLARAASLIFASEMAPEQVISILRYAQTLVVIVLLANILTFHRNRTLFIKGMVVGAVIDAVGGLFLLIWSGGEQRGFWLGLDTFKISVFLLLFYCLSFSEKSNRFRNALTALVLTLGILATGIRTAIALFLISLFVLFWTRRKAMIKIALAVLLISTLAFSLIVSLFPRAQQEFGDRTEQVWSGGGTIGLRLILWEMALAAYITHPITGIGSGGFARQQNALYSQINDAYSSEYDTLYESLSTHNTVLGTAAETGTVGLLAYFVWMVAVVKVCFRAIRLERIHHDLYVLAACVCVIAMMTEDWWGQASFIPTSSCLIGFLLGWCRARTEIDLRNSQAQPATNLAPAIKPGERL